jgi:hypothetical protein
MKMKKKKKSISPSKQFKRFLKEHQLFPYYQKVVKPNKGIKEFFKTTNPMDYLGDPPITNKFSKEEQLYAKNFLKSYLYDWETYLNIIPYIEDIKYKFIMFLKKRNAYELYLNCFNPYYVNEKIIYLNTLAQWRRMRTEPIVIERPDNITSWEQINPKFYLLYTFNIQYTIKPESFWTELNDKWQKELNKITHGK